MAQTQRLIPCDDIDPIDIVETVALHHQWEFDRPTEDEIAMTVEGQWRTYSVSLSWSAREQVLRLISSFDMDPPPDRLGALYEVLNLANDQVWDGAFTFWAPQRLMVWRYGLILTGEVTASAEQVSQMIDAALAASERFYPAFQMTCWGDASPASALTVAMGAMFGRA
jgi:hypothetical protein